MPEGKPTKQEARRSREKSGVDRRITSEVEAEREAREADGEATNDRVDNTNDRIDNTNDNVGSLESFRDRPQGHATQNEMNTVHADVTQLQGFRDRNDGFAKLQHDHTWGEVENKPDEFIPRTHGNDAHDPQFQPKGAPKSISFRKLPQNSQIELLSRRNAVRSNRDTSATNAAAIANLQHAVLHLMHLVYDSPEMTAEAGRAALQNDERYGYIWDLMETLPAPASAFFHTSRGPDVFAGGYPGYEGNANEPWYPPKDASCLGAAEAASSGRTVTVDLSGAAVGEVVVVFVASSAASLSALSAPAGWIINNPSAAGEGTRVARVYKEKSSSDGASAQIVVGGGDPFSAAQERYAARIEAGLYSFRTGSFPVVPETVLSYAKDSGALLHALTFDGASREFELSAGLTELIWIGGDGSTPPLLVAEERTYAGQGVAGKMVQPSSSEAGGWFVSASLLYAGKMTFDEALGASGYVEES